jgi:hypothetical protein
VNEAICKLTELKEELAIAGDTVPTHLLSAYARILDPFSNVLGLDYAASTATRVFAKQVDSARDELKCWARKKLSSGAAYVLRIAGTDKLASEASENLISLATVDAFTPLANAGASMQQLVDELAASFSGATAYEMCGDAGVEKEGAEQARCQYTRSRPSALRSDLNSGVLQFADLQADEVLLEGPQHTAVFSASMHMQFDGQVHASGATAGAGRMYINQGHSTVLVNSNAIVAAETILFKITNPYSVDVTLDVEVTSSYQLRDHALAPGSDVAAVGFSSAPTGVQVEFRDSTQAVTAGTQVPLPFAPDATNAVRTVTVTVPTGDSVWLRTVNASGASLLGALKVSIKKGVMDSELSERDFTYLINAALTSIDRRWMCSGAKWVGEVDSIMRNLATYSAYQYSRTGLHIANGVFPHSPDTFTRGLRVRAGQLVQNKVLNLEAGGISSMNKIFDPCWWLNLRATSAFVPDVTQFFLRFVARARMLYSALQSDQAFIDSQVI